MRISSSRPEPLAHLKYRANETEAVSLFLLPQAVSYICHKKEICQCGHSSLLSAPLLKDNAPLFLHNVKIHKKCVLNCLIGFYKNTVKYVIANITIQIM